MDGGDARDLYGTLKQGLTEHKMESSKGFSFGEAGWLRTMNKVTCCDFSSDGKFLASAGHDKKAVIWHMDTLQIENTPEEHQFLITDTRFRPNSTQLATASFDKSVRVWDAANQGGSAQVRFQPVSGHVLAAASDKVVSIFDVETDKQIHTFQGHSGVVNYLCWDLNGDYLASVSEDSVKVWSLDSKDCIHEVSSNGNPFHSCVFHPSYSALLVIGGLRSFELWNMAENKSMIVPAHGNIIAALAQSPVTGMVASASHDSSVKLWK